MADRISEIQSDLELYRKQVNEIQAKVVRLEALKSNLELLIVSKEAMLQHLEAKKEEEK